MAGVLHKKWTTAKSDAEKQKLSLKVLPKEDLGKKLDEVETALAAYLKSLDGATKLLASLDEKYNEAMTTLNKYIVESLKDKPLNKELGGAFVDIARLLKGNVRGCEQPTKNLSEDAKARCAAFK